MSAFSNAFNAFGYNKHLSSTVYSQTLHRAVKAVEESGGWPRFPEGQDQLDALTEGLTRKGMDELFGRNVIATGHQIAKSGLRWRELRPESGSGEVPDDQGP